MFNKGLLVLSQTTASASHDVQVQGQTKFNCVRLAALTMLDRATGLSFGRLSPYFVVVDSIKPYCFERIGTQTAGTIGGAQWNGTGYDCTDQLAYAKRTSLSVDTCRTPITVSIVDSAGVPVSIVGVGQPYISVAITLWEATCDEIVSMY